MKNKVYFIYKINGSKNHDEEDRDKVFDAFRNEEQLMKITREKNKGHKKEWERLRRVI